MKRVDAWYLPDRDTHFKPWMVYQQQWRDGRLCYQLHKYDAAMQVVRQRRVAVDVGAHVGFWSYWMAQDFDVLHAFEPCATHRECWLANLMPRDGLTLHPEALGAVTGMVDLIQTIDNSGNTRIWLDSTPGLIPIARLDDFTLPVLDFLKIDCEGYEAFVIDGAMETLQRCRPTVIVEQKRKCGVRYGRRDDEAVVLLESLGAELVSVVGGDYVLTFPVEGTTH